MARSFKEIRNIFQPPQYHMVGDGFRVHNFFPALPEIGLKGMSPFFLMDYNSKWKVPPSEKQRGVGVHPHRGFETVSIAYHGRIAHHDSAGNSGVIYEGDVQWMTAGSGILHKEYHEKEFSLKGGLFQMVQLWVNLPSKYKMTAPKYQPLENREMGKFFLDDKNSRLDIIAGEYKGVKGPAFTFTPMSVFNGFLAEKSKIEFSFPEHYNTGLLMIGGEVIINDSRKAAEDNFVYFGNNGSEISVEALKESIFLILSGEPINEPVESYGPFVMNTREEINQAYEDYYNGKFGYLED